MFILNKVSSILALFITAISSSDSKVCHETDDNTIKTCVGIFDVVHKCNSEFVEKAMSNSDPFSVCTNDSTFTPYRITMDYYKKLFTTYDQHNTTVLCSDLILNKNRMNVIMNFITNTKTLWETANCDKCYNDTSKVQNFSRSTERFIELHDLFDQCVQNVTKAKNISLVCSTCDADYLTLNSIYEEIKLSGDNQICFDLEDKMNKTRREWSSVFKCCKDKRDSLTAFYSVAATIFCLAAAFYGTVYYVGVTYPQVDTLDEREVSRGNHIDGQGSSNHVSAAGSTSSSSTKNKQLVINDDTDDDEPLIGRTYNVPLNN